MLFNSSDYDRAHLIGYDKGYSDGHDSGYRDAFEEHKGNFEDAYHKGFMNSEKQLKDIISNLREKLFQSDAEIQTLKEKICEVERARSGDIGRMFGSYSEGYTDGYNAANKQSQTRYDSGYDAGIENALNDTTKLEEELEDSAITIEHLREELKILRADFERIKDIDITPEEYVKALLKYNAKEEFNKGFQQGVWKTEYKYSSEKYGM